MRIRMNFSEREVEMEQKPDYIPRAQLNFSHINQNKFIVIIGKRDCAAQ